MSLFTKVRNVVTHAAVGALNGVTGGFGGDIVQSLFSGLGGGGGSGSAPGMPGSGGIPGISGTTTAIYGATDAGGMMNTAGALRSAIPVMRGFLTSARGIVSTISGKLVGVMRGSKLLRVRQIADLAKRVGLEATAAALGVTAVEAAQLIAAHLMQSSSARKRGRGISARDVRTTRRTIQKIRSIEHAIGGTARPRARSRARAAPAAFIRQG